MTRKEVLEYLVASTPSEFIGIFSNVSTERNLYSKAEIQNGLELKIVLCQASRYSGPSHEGVERSWQFEPVASANPEEDWSAFEGQGYWENGHCTNCDLEITSYAKSALCPLCGEPVHLT